MQRKAKQLALFAPVAFLLCLTVGCATTDVARVLPLLSDLGGYRTSVLEFGGIVRYSLISIHPGHSRSLVCNRSSYRESGHSSLALTVRDCLGIRSLRRDQYMDHFDRVNHYLVPYFGQGRVRAFEIVLVPPGVRHVNVSRGLRRARALRLSMAFRDDGFSESYMRQAVRTFAHEMTHLAAEVKGRGSRPEEYVAGVSESCAEFFVFGDTRGFVFEDNVSSFKADDFDVRQRESLQNSRTADAKVTEYYDEGRNMVLSDSGGAFASFCHAVLTSIDNDRTTG